MNRRELLTLQLREDIGSAILDLMREKPLDKITVDEISERANVGRATFYRQFGSREEAISYKLYRDWIHFEEAQGIRFEDTSPKEFSKAFFEFIYSLRETNALLIANSRRHCISDAMRLAFENINNQANKKEYYHDHFRAYGLAGLIEGWIDADYDLTIDEMADLAVDFFYKV